MKTQTEALKLALEALDQLTNVADTFSVSGVYLNEEVWAKKCLSDAYFAITTIKEALAQPEQEHEVLGFNGWGFPIEKPNKALIEKTADHDVDCLCIDCSMVDEQDDVPWTDKAFERLCENWNNMTSAEFAIVQRFLFGVYAHPPVPTAQPKEPLVINSQEKASEFIEKTLWEVIDVAAMFPKAKPDPRTWEHLMVYSPQPKEPEQEPVAWRYKPAREDNPRWEYTTNHPLDMGDGYIRPSLVEYCKCIEPLYAKEKPKLMLEKFREMEDLLEEPAQQEPATKEKIREAIVFNLPLYTTPPYVPTERQRKPLTHEQRFDLLTKFEPYKDKWEAPAILIDMVEAAHGIKE